MIVYHGSSLVIETPDILHSFRPLDFGKGFYVTSSKEQAARWANRKSLLSLCNDAYINVYQMSNDFRNLKVKDFGEDLQEWIDFVCECRDGGMSYTQYDLIKGKVADDKVFRVVDMYHAGVWDKERALKEIKAYPTYDQISFVTQAAIDSLLVFSHFERV